MNEFWHNCKRYQIAYVSIPLLANCSFSFIQYNAMISLAKYRTNNIKSPSFKKRRQWVQNSWIDEKKQIE